MHDCEVSIRRSEVENGKMAASCQKDRETQAILYLSIHQAPSCNSCENTFVADLSRKVSILGRRI
jgi:hypothetical protein